MSKFFIVLLVVLSLVLVCCGQDDDGFGRLGECYDNEVPCTSGECCPGGTVCCSDQNILWAACCPAQAAYCCETGGMVECNPEPCGQ